MKRLLLSLLLIASVNAAEKKDAYGQLTRLNFVSDRLDNLKVYYCSKCFYVKDDDLFIELDNENLDSTLRSITPEKLKEVLKDGFLTLTRLSDDEYFLSHQVPNKV